METLTFHYKATKPVLNQAHVGVVASGDLEILLEPLKGEDACVVVRTAADGFGAIWAIVLERFFTLNDIAANIEINDFGATPGMVSMRLLQALEVCGNEKAEG